MPTSSEVIYQATRGGICAGWVEVGGRIVAQAPVLRRWLAAPSTSRAVNLRRAGFDVQVVGTPPELAVGEGEAREA